MLDWIFTKTPLLFLVQSVWRDEAFSYLLAKKPLWEIAAITAKDFNPPLYYVLLHMYMWIFGGSEIMLRAFSLIFFNITIYAAYLIIEQILGDKKTSKWIYLGLFAFNPFLFYYGVEARMYAMTACFTTLSWYFLYTKRPRKYLLTVVLGLYTHYFFLLVAFSQFIYMMITKTRTREQKHAYVRHMITAGVFFLVWVLFLFSQHPPVGKGFWILPPSLYDVLNAPGMLLTGYEDSFYFPKMFSLIPYTVLFVITVIVGFKHAIKTRHEKDLFLLLALWTAVPVIVTLILTPLKPLFLPRYLMISTPGILLMIIYLISKMPTRQMRIAFISLFFIAFTSYHYLQINHRHKADFRSRLAEIKRIAGKDDIVFVDNELNFHPAQYYFDPNRVYIIGKSYDEIPDYVGKILIPRDRIVSAPPRYPQKAFIIHEDLSYDIQSLY